jgi:hypothetical protein
VIDQIPYLDVPDQVHWHWRYTKGNTGAGRPSETAAGVLSKIQNLQILLEVSLSGLRPDRILACTRDVD